MFAPGIAVQDDNYDYTCLRQKHQSYRDELGLLVQRQTVV